MAVAYGREIDRATLALRARERAFREAQRARKSGTPKSANPCRGPMSWSAAYGEDCAWDRGWEVQDRKERRDG